MRETRVKHCLQPEGRTERVNKTKTGGKGKARGICHYIRLCNNIKRDEMVIRYVIKQVEGVEGGH